MTALYTAAIVLGIISIVGLIFLATLDASKRGFSGTQIYLIRLASFIFFPVGLIIYLLFRPAIRLENTKS
jgi:hypothetical protein